MKKDDDALVNVVTYDEIMTMCTEETTQSCLYFYPDVQVSILHRIEASLFFLFTNTSKHLLIYCNCEC